MRLSPLLERSLSHELSVPQVTLASTSRVVRANASTCAVIMKLTDSPALRTICWLVRRPEFGGAMHAAAGLQRHVTESTEVLGKKVFVTSPFRVAGVSWLVTVMVNVTRLPGMMVVPE